MLLLRKAHLGEVSVTVWPKVLKEMCAKKNIFVLESPGCVSSRSQRSSASPAGPTQAEFLRLAGNVSGSPSGSSGSGERAEHVCELVRLREERRVARVELDRPSLRERAPYGG